MSQVLFKYSNIEMAPTYFKPQTLLFDPEREKLGVGPILVRLLGFPLHLWSEDIFQCIGDNLWHFLDYEIGYLKTVHRAYSRIMIHMETKEGLVSSMALHYSELGC